MALSPKVLISFLLLVILFSAQVQARDSQFFSKVSATTKNDNTVVTVPSNNEQQQQALNKQEQDPAFIPETQNGYGLYGHESTEDWHATTTPTTTATFAPYTTQSQETNKKNNYYNNNAYEAQQQNLGETRLQENSYTTMANKNNNNQYYYNNGGGGYNNIPSYQENNNNYDGRGGGYNRVPTKEGSYTTTLANQDNINYNNNKYKYNNVERQGMSDTRFLENGKYYFDVNNEQNYFPNKYVQNSRGVASRNEYKTAGGYYGNNNENTNSMGRYQNNQLEDEFGENAEFEP